MHENEKLFSSLTRMTDEGENTEPHWTAKGILFVSYQRAHHTNSQVYILDPATGTQSRLSFSDGVTYKPILVGENIVYASSTDEEKENPNLEKLTGKPTPSVIEVERAVHLEQKLLGMDLYSRRNARETSQRLTKKSDIDIAEASDLKGKRILRTSIQDDRAVLSWFTIGGGEQIFMTLKGTLLPSPRPSPDGKELAWIQSGTEGRTEILLGGPSGQKPKAIVSRISPFRDLNWSPDGQWLYFAAQLSEPQWDVYRVNKDGSCIERLTADSEPDFSPTLSLDGKKLAFTSYRTGDAELYIAELQESSNRTCL